MTAALKRILAEIATADQCRIHNGVETGGIVLECPDVPRIVTLACEHEHFYDAALCERHIAEVSERPLQCPCCRSALGVRHMCRHAVLEPLR